MRVTPRIVTGQSDWDAGYGPRRRLSRRSTRSLTAAPGRDCCGDRVWH